MTVISVNILKNNLADTLNKITKKKEYLLVEKSGEITSALVNIDLFEDLLALASKEYKDSIKKARKEYEEGKVFTHKQVFGDL